MPKQHQKTSTNGNSHSYIYSDASKAIYREETLIRKLKHLQQQNNDLEEKIKEQEQEIKDQRTVIIYQMGELAKAVASKLNVFEDFKVKRDMFLENGQEVHDGLKILMEKFEDIEKEARMINKVRTHLEKMHEIYIEHKDSIQQIMQQSTSFHHQSQQKLRALIHQKKQQVQQNQSENAILSLEINLMKQEMKQFEAEEPILDQLESELRQKIANKEKEIEQQAQKYVEVSKWAQIVVDRKQRAELTEGLKKKGKQLRQASLNKSKVEIAMREHGLRVGK